MVIILFSRFFMANTKGASYVAGHDPQWKGVMLVSLLRKTTVNV